MLFCRIDESVDVYAIRDTVLTIVLMFMPSILLYSMLMIVLMHNIVCCTLLTNGYFNGHAVLEAILVIRFFCRIVLL